MFSAPSFNRLLEVLPSRQSQQNILSKVISFHGLLLLVSLATAPIVYNALCLGPYNIPHRTRRHPSLGTVEVHDNLSRRLLKRAMDLYPPDIHGINTGKYVDLPLGKTRYWLIGPESGKKVVLIAGLSMPSLIKSLLVPHLASNGFHVLLYDLYGRGYTEAPCASEVKYDTEMYVTQLALLLGHVGWDKAAIVGSSVGGGIAIAFSAHFPQMVDGKVGLIGSCGVMPQWEPPRSVRRAVSPALQYLRLSYLGKLVTRKKIPPQLPTPVTQLVDKGHALMQDLEELVQIQHYLLPGYTQAIASTLVHGPIRNLETEYAVLALAAAEKRVDVILIWGTEDEIVDYNYALKMKQAIPSAQFVSFQGAKHDVIVFWAEEVREALLRFLKN